MKKKVSIGHVLIVAVLIFLAILCLYPMWYTLVVSFSDKIPVEGGRVWIVPVDFTTESYAKLMKDSTFFTSFLVSCERAILGCSLNMLMIVLTAYPMCLPKKHFPDSKWYKWFFIANMLFSGGMIPAYVIMRQYKLFDTIWALVLPGAVPLWNVIMMINFFRNVPYDLHEAATIDGANPLTILFRIYIPLSLPSLACLLLFAFVGHWNAYFDGLLYITDNAKQPLQTYIYQMKITIDYTTMTPEQIQEALKMSNKTLESAKVFIAMVPILCIYPFLQRYFATGLVIGSVKG